jgi:TPP-dependent trihydroxycyclohexane-1,2-dione (THcHDO) dehydratase
MTPDKLRDRRRLRIQKQRRAVENAAMAAAVESMSRGPTAKELIKAAALASAIVGPILFLAL